MQPSDDVIPVPRSSRRRLLQGALALGALSSMRFGPPRTRAQSRPGLRRFIACELHGGWDVLLGPDPRDPARRYPGIDLGTDLLARDDREPFEVRVGGASHLWGPTMAPLREHADVVTVFRGVNMNTVAHPTGQAYGNTCVLPSGTAARGSSLGAVFAAAATGADAPILPFVAIGTPAYAEGLPGHATALRLERARDLGTVLRPTPRELPSAIEALLAAAAEDAVSCIGPRYVDGPAEERALARERLARLRGGDYAARFAFSADSEEMRLLRTLYGFRASDTDALPAVRAATAARLVKTGLVQAVSVRLYEGFDTHLSNWSTVQPTRQRTAFAALAAMITDLRADDPNLERTTVYVHSDFARTPRLNGNQGRDHWFAGSMLVIGGLRPGVVGATNEDDLGLVRLDPATLAPTSDRAGLQLRPEHVAASIVAAAGLDAGRYRVSPPAGVVP